MTVLRTSALSPSIPVEENIPKHPRMRIVALKPTVHNPPVDIRTDPLKLHPHPLPHHTPRPVRPNHIPRPHHLLTTLPLQRHPHRVLPLILHLEPLHGRQSLHQLPVPHEVADEDALDLSLRDDVESPVARIGLVGGREKELLAVFVDRRVCD